jgi:K(+)-stimulated pyrophosphate-energized sodium pump
MIQVVNEIFHESDSKRGFASGLHPITSLLATEGHLTMSRDTLVRWLRCLAFALVVSCFLPAFAHASSEASLKLPSLSDQSQKFLGMTGHTLLMWGLIICAGGLAFGLYYYSKLRKLPVHRSMLEVSELIYQTCKAYLIKQGKFILVLWAFIAAIIVVYFGVLQPGHEPAAGAAAEQTLPTFVQVGIIYSSR